jgi:hypothetical protein
LRIGRISAGDQFDAFGEESAGNLAWDFLERLHLGGRAAADDWLKREIPASRPRTSGAFGSQIDIPQ